MKLIIKLFQEVENIYLDSNLIIKIMKMKIGVIFKEVKT